MVGGCMRIGSELAGGKSSVHEELNDVDGGGVLDRVDSFDV